MRFHLISLLVAFFITFAFALKNQKPILVTYPDDTPQSVVNEAMDVLKKAGGVITHEYSLFKGFAAKASESTIDTIKTLGEEWVPIVENDVVVSVNNS